jgi:hypothetical protein
MNEDEFVHLVTGHFAIKTNELQDNYRYQQENTGFDDMQMPDLEAGPIPALYL